MKKTFMFGAMILLAGCISATGDYEKAKAPAAQPIQPEPTVVQVVPAAMPCYSGCAQSGCKTEPLVLKPRVLEKKQAENKRPCCIDEAVMQPQQDEYYVPDAPEIYVISANRTVNSMQAEAVAFFKQVGKMKVFIEKAQPKAKDLPGGMDKGTETLKSRFEQMENVTIVKKIKDADYVVVSTADWYDTATKTVPAIKYDLFLNAPDGQVIGEWSEIIHQAQGDRSWW